MEQAKFPANSEKIAELNRLLKNYPPLIEDEKRYNFKKKIYEKKDIGWRSDSYSHKA